MAKILIVDDSKLIRRNLRIILTKAGHEIIAEAENGLQAFQEYEKNKPDLITMDISMPLMDGVAAVKKIVSQYPDAIIIMVSAMDQKNMVMAAIQSGARNYIIKPFSPDKVVAVVNAALASMGKAVAASQQDSTLEEKQVLYPFYIEAHDTNVRVTIKQSFASGHIKPLLDALQSFFNKKPLQVTFDFASVQIYEYSLIDQLIELMQTIKDNEGKLRVLAEDKKITRYVKSKGII
jgi:two-component system chemotaxis response regulator CheY